MQTNAWMLAGALAVTAQPAMASELDSTVAAQAPWARWQGRLSLGTHATTWRLGAEAPAPKLNNASLMGDYYFGRSLASPTRLGGFRATTGLVFGTRAALETGQPSLASGNTFSAGTRVSGPSLAPYTAESAADSGTATYFGVGYTGLAVRSGWSFNADLGLLSPGASAAARWGRGLTNSQVLDDAIRQMRMTPLLQLGAAYSF